ncbi:uncharacterized protein LOC129407834 [Boleophthalmus pectinirostris]|uniref:uncharacterized protein LOC129407834 n=1 Tax=Boleophthalmus pectinirostris TaxID=150288 RepID=UPI00242F3C19|nr:uncharacterized protein LOC129407834 [Boleophthalmus pectinirostris]
MCVFSVSLVFCGVWTFHFVQVHTGDVLWGFEAPLLDGAPVDSCGNSIRLPPPVDPPVATATEHPSVAMANEDPPVAKNKPTPPKPAVQSKPAPPKNGPIRPQPHLSFLLDILTQPIRAQPSSSESSEDKTASHGVRNSPPVASFSSEEN